MFSITMVIWGYSYMVVVLISTTLYSESEMRDRKRCTIITFLKTAILLPYLIIYTVSAVHLYIQMYFEYSVFVNKLYEIHQSLALQHPWFFITQPLKHQL